MAATMRSFCFFETVKIDVSDGFRISARLSRFFPPFFLLIFGRSSPWRPRVAFVYFETIKTDVSVGSQIKVTHFCQIKSLLRSSEGRLCFSAAADGAAVLPGLIPSLHCNPITEKQNL